VVRDATEVRSLAGGGRVRPSHRRRGRRGEFSRPEDRSLGTLPKEDRRGYCEGNREGLEGPPRDGEANRAEPAGESDGGAIRRRAGHQGAEGTRKGQEEDEEHQAQWEHLPRRRG